MKPNKNSKKIENLNQLSDYVDYSFIDRLVADPQANMDGYNHHPREVFRGHYVPVMPTPISHPKYISHSKKFFKELGLSDDLAQSEDFIKLFSGDTSHLKAPFKKTGWASGYALSIYGTEYYNQCPFQTGNGYGDGRAISILEVVLSGKRWEMQLKGGGRTPYCRGADGRAVLRSSIREFLAQEHMDSLGVPTSRSLSLYVSQDETVKRPWFYNNSYSKDPELMIDEPVAITTRVASSFLRVGQLELFGRRARKNEHKNAHKELEMLVLYTIDREYGNEIDQNLPLLEKLLLLAKIFQKRLISLVVDWLRVGYCQGNFNSDNCAMGGFTLDYGPFGFIDMFDPEYQPWTGGGVHFSFFNQAQAAARNFHMFCVALSPLFDRDLERLKKLEDISENFAQIINNEMEKMWGSKMGLEQYNQSLFYELMDLMIETGVDYTIFFRELSEVPENVQALKKSFYNDDCKGDLLERWKDWFEKWSVAINIDTQEAKEQLSSKMKQINPKYTLREWFLVPAYEAAQKGDYTLIYELQEVMNDPYGEQSKEMQEKYYKKKPSQLFGIAGVSHVSCSS